MGGLFPPLCTSPERTVLVRKTDPVNLSLDRGAVFIWQLSYEKSVQASQRT